MERVAVDHPAFAQREDLHRGAFLGDGDADDVDRADRLPLDCLPLAQPLDRRETVPVARCVLEPLLGRRLAHLLLESPPDRAVVARQELDHLLDQLAVVLLRDVTDARRMAALDVEVEARDAAVPTRLRALARPVPEHPVEHVERLAHLLRVRIGPEVDDAAPVSLAGEHDPRIVVLDGDGDVRERLVVAEPHVERRPVPLDQALLEVQRLDLRLGDDRLDRLDAVGHLPDALARVARTGLEVRTDARTQRFRLADVEHLGLRVPEEIDPGTLRHTLQLALDAVCGHRVASVPRR